MAMPTTPAIRVPHEALHQFVYDIAKHLKMPEEHAVLLAKLLIKNDLRGFRTHGSWQMSRYAHEILGGRINPNPNIQCSKETSTSVTFDGDGGLGYFPAYQGTLKAIGKAKEHGMAAMVSRNHGHIGAAGIYSRMPLEHDMIAFATSGVQLDLKPGDLVYEAAGQSPMSFSAPSGSEPPLVIDAGVTHDLQGNAVHRDEIAALAPGLVLRAIGFGAICQTWGGLLTGIPIDLERAVRPYRSANQGAMLFVVQISLFADVEQFKKEMDEYVQRVRKLTPIAGTTGAFLPGDIDAMREVENLQTGVPIDAQHKASLEKLAGELNMTVPW